MSTLVFVGERGKWGGDFVSRVFNCPRRIFINPEYQDTAGVPENPIIVTNNSSGYELIRRVQKMDTKYAVVLLSDETLQEPMDWYLDDENCVFAARNYLHPKYHLHPKVVTFPLGYCDGLYYYVGNHCPRVEQRKITWSFCGSLKADREAAIHCFKEIRPYQTNIFELFHDPNHLNAEEYAYILSKSKFVLCPQGGCNLDSFRIYEALQAGCIPVTLKNHAMFKVEPSYWHAIFPGHSKLPFVCEDTWEQCALKVKKLLDDPEALAKAQKSCIDMWQNHLKLLTQDLALRTSCLQD